MKPINERMTVAVDGDFVVFLIGMRFNKPWKFWKWFPVASAMPRMLRELSENPETGFLCGESWFGKTTISVQYWRSLEDLLRYAHDRKRPTSQLGGSSTVR